MKAVPVSDGGEGFSRIVTPGLGGRWCPPPATIRSAAKVVLPAGQVRDRSPGVSMLLADFRLTDVKP